MMESPDKFCFSNNICCLHRWLNSFMKKGNRKTLDLKDLYQVMRGDQANELGNNLEQ